MTHRISPPLSILTQNLWFTNSRGKKKWDETASGVGAWHERCSTFQKWLALLNPDVICLQEVLIGGKYDMVADIFGSMPSYAHRAHIIASPWWVDNNVGFCNAIVSKYPIKKQIILRLPELYKLTDVWQETRAALTCILDTPHGDISVTCTHLNYKYHHSAIRLKQAVALAAFVQKNCPKGKDAFPPILCGDFNANSESIVSQYLRGETAIDTKTFGIGIDGAQESIFFHDAWLFAGKNDISGRGVTWARRNSYTHDYFERDQRLDYIYVGPWSKNEKGVVETCRVVCDHDFTGTFPSDHFGVFARLRTTPNLQPPRSLM